MRVEKIGIVSRFDNQEALDMVKNIMEAFEDKVDIVLSPGTAQHLDIDDKCMPVEDMRDAGVELIVSVGGDGTVLRSISKMEDPLPTLGINLGTLGFLVDVQPEDALTAINDVLKGFTYTERSRLGVYLNGRALLPATNEVVLITARPAKILTFRVSVDDSMIEELRADGVVFATPTGSTAYAMSAGGPIVDPRVDASLIVPLAPFKLSARPWVVPASSRISVEMLIPEKEAAIVIDGQHSYNIKASDRVVLTKAQNPARFVSSSINGFYEKVQSKLS
ncbi:NAD(+)/NADH kinase [Methanolobus zinderi]|jgi:NAD+ kinase|uniref:NAD kinase n=1 Tax=Methanolobus zinderi TaxID=536044 RepID=A0A7D5I988_9EURY|nr:NAD(+)/NADH kinase [Methanolobus zinderi]KXS42580.1 MAG: NAD(+) kinase [Methanolobus sp. T82-4]QLC50222.1 NAD(+)/NADH kinase [Methanolobus zinderi]